jgi:hypothetical protein
MSDVEDLSIRAFKIIKMFSEDRIPDKFRLEEAVEQLNLIIGSLNNSEQYIPLLATIEFDTVVNQRTYRVGNNVSYDVVNNKPITIDYLRINDAGTVYILDKKDKNTFYTSYVNEVTKRRPRWFFEQEGVDYMDLIFFELPDRVYSCTAEGKFSFSNVDANGSLSEFPARYITYLTLELARRLQLLYPSQPWTAIAEKQYGEAKKSVTNKNALDLSVKYVGYAKCTTKYNRRYDRGGDRY